MEHSADRVEMQSGWRMSSLTSDEKAERRTQINQSVTTQDRSHGSSPSEFSMPAPDQLGSFAQLCF
jgi:hypothetical protein